MKKSLLHLAGMAGLLVSLTTGLSAETVLGKISTLVLIFTSLAGAAVWIYAVKKRRELDE